MDIEQLKKQLNTPYYKNKMQYCRQLKEYILQNAGFTSEEQDIFEMRSNGMTVLEISFEMQSKYKHRRHRHRIFLTLCALSPSQHI